MDNSSINFDNNLLRENSIQIEDFKCYDILREIWKSLGNNPNIFNKSTHSGYGLERMCEINF